MKYLKTFVFMTFFVGFFSMAFAQNIDFDISNFKGKEKDFKTAKKNLENGLILMRSGAINYNQALTSLLKANDFNPNNAPLNYYIFQCYAQLDKWSTALPYIKKSVALMPDGYLDAKRWLGKAFQMQMKFDSAIIMYQDYKKDIPDNDAEGAAIDKNIAECMSGKKLVANPVNVSITNIGNTINTANPEYGPFVNADETVLFFTSRRENTTGGMLADDDRIYYEDIYFSEKISGKWSAPINPSRPLNSDQHDAAVGISPDGQTLMIYKGSNGGDLFECKAIGNTWSVPKRLNGNVNTKYHEPSGAVSYDGKTLYFVSDRPGGLGGSDIYVCTKTLKGDWGKPQNLGSTINTAYDEDCVFLHPDGKTLYFSSKGHNSMGGYDIFKTHLVNGKWTEPENLGYPINTPGDDVFFTIAASGKHAFYSSEKDDSYGGQDIYMIEFAPATKPIKKDTLIAEVKPTEEVKTEEENQVTILKGKVLDETTLQPIGAEIEITDNEKNETIAELTSNSATGKYLIALPSGKNYGISVKAENYIFHSENLNIPSTSSYTEINKDLLMKKVEIGKSIVLNNIFFDFDKSTLRPESYPELEKLIAFLNEFPTVKIEISGHTDNKGTAAYNKPLSESRAQTVVDYLISKGISKSRLTYAGYGFDRPIATNDTDEGRQLNRRTEFKIIEK